MLLLLTTIRVSLDLKSFVLRTKPWTRTSRMPLGHALNTARESKPLGLIEGVSLLVISLLISFETKALNGG